MIRAITVIMGISFLMGCTVFGVRNAEQPSYDVLQRDGQIEVRRYESLLIASTKVDGSDKNSSNIAFKRLAKYIFGENRSAQNMDMTAPVTQEMPRNKIAMTAPVLQDGSDTQMVMSFVMPSKYTFDTLPKPIDPTIKLDTVPERKIASIQYSGRWSTANTERQTAKLQQWLKQQDVEAISVPISAAYDPPWTLPFLRRNEVHIEIQ